MTATYGNASALCGKPVDACTVPSNVPGNGAVTSASIVISPSAIGGSAYFQLMVHEIGHTYGAADCDSCPDTALDSTFITTSSPSYPTCCDAEWLSNSGSGYGLEYCDDDSCGVDSAPCLNNGNCGNPDIPTCDSGCCVETEGGGGGGSPDCESDGQICTDDTECCTGSCIEDNTCENEDPIVIDLSGQGYLLTDAQHGVEFDFFGTGKRLRISWTASGWDGGFLALDRNGNGRIDDGAELFSNVTPQTAAMGKGNGFAALAVFDQTSNGGNGDGWIDNNDAVYSKLRIWVDKNHNGVSEPGELLTLPQAGVEAIFLSDNKAKWTDAYGNVFRYESHAKTTTSNDEIIYDVLLNSHLGGKAK